MRHLHPLRDLDETTLRARTSLKWREYPPDVLPLWVAEMDVVPARPVVDALKRAVESGDTGYPHGNGYAEALADFAADRWSWTGLDPQRTAYAADVMTGLSEVLRLVSAPGDPVVVNPPVYPPFFGFTEHADRMIVEAPLGEDGRLDLGALEAAFLTAGGSGRPVTYLLCNPHNPTAVAHTMTELTAVAALAATHGVRVVVDEIHGPLVPGDFVPYLSIPGAEDAFAVTSASKSWNLAGLKAAVIIAGERAAGDLERLPEIVSHGPSHLGMIAHTVALREGVAWLDAVQADLAENRALLAELLAEHLPGVRWARGDATYLAWLDCRDLRLGDDPAAAFLEQGRVAVNSGLPFGTGGAGHVRLNIATSPQILTEAITRMASVAGHPD
ncbi:MalY/PatB family protein [Aeromicrobium wangtongii]|uniref:cysteine-S-conjugate beta-lyase n=1 Tax=Aeromicrobium wangtongii TaxID=2969247 RepID=A0ABY5MDL9_9ACTN|nr:aminotransferase class I/II-fold pyridoxal phosphate-dependent enzyme [Aeromicrobium wangtongii]MCD9199563.1 aminotransferase class I/II-fold pyridoxal phosphate-dependent enzyme [Aeromicrobium wangtongii]UUP13916.1 aminotransferase class I/II-fold pyridoxal phosphate-dependent enzyme [Aeromicrobium wangtongii]